MTIRSGRAADLEALNALYNHYVGVSAATFDTAPRSLSWRHRWFEQFADDGAYRLVVADLDGAPGGFAYSSRLRSRPAYDISVETTVYVRHDALGLGIGRQLYAALFGALAGQPLHRAYAAVTLPNPASEALHEACGFRVAGTFDEVGYKFGRYWSVRWYEKPLDQPQSRPRDAGAA